MKEYTCDAPGCPGWAKMAGPWNPNGWWSAALEFGENAEKCLEQSADVNACSIKCFLIALTIGASKMADDEMYHPNGGRTDPEQLQEAADVEREASR